MKRMVSDVCHTVRNGETCDLVVTERILSDVIKPRLILINVKRLDVIIHKSLQMNSRYTIWNRNLSKIISSKCFLVYSIDCVWNHNTFQAFFIKCPLSNSRN